MEIDHLVKSDESLLYTLVKELCILIKSLDKTDVDIGSDPSAEYPAFAESLAEADHCGDILLAYLRKIHQRSADDTVDRPDKE